MKGENTKLKFGNCEWFACRDRWTLKSFIWYSWFSTNFFMKIIMWYLVEAEEKFNIPKGLKDIPLYTCTKWLSLPEKTLFWLLFHPLRKEHFWSPAGKQFPWCQYFSINPNSALFFLELTRMGFSWESRVQRPTVNEQVFVLEGVMNYVDPMGFLGGKERIISNTHKK